MGGTLRQDEKPTRRDSGRASDEQMRDTGMRFQVSVDRVSKGQGPQIHLNLRRRRYPEAPSPAFAPHRLPELVDLVFWDVGPGQIDYATLDMEARLSPGIHEYPLAGGARFQVEVQEGTTAKFHLDVSRPPDASGPVVRRLELTFDAPLVLSNVLHTLVEVQHLFQDRQVADLLAGIKRHLPPLDGIVGAVEAMAGGVPDRLRRRFGDRLPPSVQGLFDRGARERLVGTLQGLRRRLGERLGRAPEEAWDIVLSSVSGSPRQRGGRWELELSFTGTVRWLDKVSHPFTNVVLPPVVLPVPYASLEELLSPNPLASGELNRARLDPLRLVSSMADSLAAATGTLSASLRVPRVHGHSETADRTRIDVDVLPHEQVRVSASVEVEALGERRFRLAARPMSLGFVGEPRHRVQASVDCTADLDLDSEGLPWRDRLTAKVSFEVEPGSAVPKTMVEYRTSHPLAVSTTGLGVEVSSLALSGSLALAWRQGTVFLLPEGRGLDLDAELRVPDGVVATRASTEIRAEVPSATSSVRLEPDPDAEGQWRASVSGRGEISSRLAMEVTPIPEIGLGDDRLEARLNARFGLEGAARVRFMGPQVPELYLVPGSRFTLELTEAMASLDGREIRLPPGTSVTGTVRGGRLAQPGSGELSLDLAWDLHGQECVMRRGGRSASLLTEALRKGEITLHLSPSGRFSLSGLGRGLYGVKYFKALLNPASEPGQIMDLIRSDDALRHVIAGLRLVDEDLADLVEALREMALGARRILVGEGIRRPGDLVPRDRIARIMSMFLVGTDELARDLEPLIQSATEGHGFDVERAKELLRGPLAGFQIDYEVDRILRWLDLVLATSEPYPRPEPVHEEPAPLDSRHHEARQRFPSAREIYDALEGPDWTIRGRPAGEVLAELAPYLSMAQLDHVLSVAGDRLEPEQERRLSYVRDVKERISKLEEGYGGLEYAAQTAMVAGFVGEAVGPLPGLDPRQGVDWPPPAALGPGEVATLMLAGLAQSRQGVQSQIHDRLLLELVASREPSFLLEVMAEMGAQNPRALTGALFAFLKQDQDELREPLDLVEFLSSRLDMPVPRQEDYLAGGHLARKSYYEALDDLAGRVLEAGMPYLAARAHLQELRHPLTKTAELPAIPGPRAAMPTEAALAMEEARRAVAEADRYARRLSFSAKGKRSQAARDKARGLYRAAFDACARFLELEPEGFKRPWLKEFWRRNEEALKVLRVVRGHQEGVDRIRPWLAARSGGPAPSGEQELLEVVVRSLYHYPEDQDRILADPLVRLLVEPDPGPDYDFTIVSAMGVVTDGKDGHELEDAYRRLEEARGVRVVRAHTGLFRSLEYNARRIIEAIEQVQGPWGWIGYSQGCPNALMAESMLMGGTPGQREAMERLVCRNLLYSAANGSVHGSSGSVKFLRAMVDGELFLKHYQALYSREFMDLVFRGMKAMMDSSMFVQTLGGTHSLTLERARLLHRDGQFATWVPSSTVRGVIPRAELPETLEYLYFCHRRLMPEGGCDSQVYEGDTLARATRVVNGYTRAFEACDMGSAVLSAHHWFPLTVEVEFLTTERDRRLAVYDAPKDIHVFPWVEVNARFGRIRARRGGAE